MTDELFGPHIIQRHNRSTSTGSLPDDLPQSQLTAGVTLKCKMTSSTSLRISQLYKLIYCMHVVYGMIDIQKQIYSFVDKLLFTFRRQTVLPSTNVRLTHVSVINNDNFHMLSYC